MALLTVQDLSLGYEGKELMNHLNFHVDRGDYLCVLGENGAGKTTLMRAILGLSAPLGGRILFGEGLKSSLIGYLPQQTAIQRDFPASVEEIVLSGCQGRCGLRPFYRRSERQLAARNMARMGILTLRDRCYRELSGGQQQRVLLSRALCAAQDVLLLDEPVSGLDPQTAAEMYDLIGGLNREGMTIIMISHDLNTALRQASHVLRLGEQTFFGTKDEYLSQAAGLFPQRSQSI